MSPRDERRALWIAAGIAAACFLAWALVSWWTGVEATCCGGPR